MTAKAVGITGRQELECGGEAKTSVDITLAQLGPKGTAAENRTAVGWVG
jgi:hypothetical protein